MAFADNLKTLPSIAHIAELQLIDDAGNLAATIPNAAGKAGSLSIYNALAVKHGSINVAAAQEGLVLFAEHPNIDRLQEVIATGKGYGVKVVAA